MVTSWLLKEVNEKGLTISWHEVTINVNSIQTIVQKKNDAKMTGRKRKRIEIRKIITLKTQLV